MIRAERHDLRVVVLFAVCSGLLSLAIPVAVGGVVSNVLGGARQLTQQVVLLALVVLVCLSLAAVLKALKTYVVEFLQRRVFVRVVADLAHRLPRARAEAFDGAHGPELVNRFFDVLTVQKASAVLLLDGLVVVIQAVIGLAVLAFYHPWLLGYDLALLAALSFVVYVMGRGAVRTSIRESYAKYAVAGWLEEMVRHPTAFKLAGGPEYALGRADALTRAYLGARQDHFRIVFRQVLFVLALQVVANVGLLLLGGLLVIENRLTLGQLVATELIVTVLISTFVKLGKSLETYYDLMASVDKLGHLTDLPRERDDGEPHRAPAGPASLRLDGVTFAYDDGRRRDVLRDLSLDVAPGERVAVTGASGTGKSTLVDLLYGLREPARGRILLDGVDLRDVLREDLRAHVAAVKGFEVFDGTVLENVRLGREDLSAADVRDALSRVGLLDEVQELPEGLHTRLCTGGAPLSLGQARRLLLARAIAGRPRLLVLDEALDDLDAARRPGVLRELFDRDNPWTLLVVTHLPEVARACDREVVLGGETPGRNHR